MFASKAYLRWEHLKGGSHLLWPYSQTLGKAGKACQEQTLQLIGSSQKLQRKIKCCWNSSSLHFMLHFFSTYLGAFYVCLNALLFMFRVTRRLRKIRPNFGQSSQNSCQTKIYSSKLKVKVQTIYIRPLLNTWNTKKQTFLPKKWPGPF
jgi:hypothetical protein